jgi:hypothetical protein
VSLGVDVSEPGTWARISFLRARQPKRDYSEKLLTNFASEWEFFFVRGE